MIDPSTRRSVAGHTGLEAGGCLLHPVPQLDEGLLERGGVRDEVRVLPAKDRALRGAQPAQLQGEHDHPQKRHRGDSRCRKGDYALGGVQVVHGRQGTQQAQRVKMTVNSASLLSVTSSPGTGFTRTVIGTFCPVGGCLVSGSSRSWPLRRRSRESSPRP